MPTSSQDARGCLSEAALQALRSAPPGQAPAELAAHAAACARCQERLLALDARTLGPRRRAQAPPRWRVFALFVACVLMVILLYGVTMRLFEASP